MRHLTVNLVWAGAHETEFITVESTESPTFKDWLNNVAIEAAESGDDVRVYVLEHDHEIGVDCECIQFATDLRPYVSFNTEATV